MNINKINNLLFNFANLSKVAFLEAPPILLEKIYKIYEDMYFQYLNKLQEEIKNKRESNSESSKKSIFYKDRISEWRNWIKNSKNEDEYSKKYFFKNVLPLFEEFVRDDQENFYFNEEIPTKIRPPLEFWNSKGIGDGVYYVYLKISKLYDNINFSNEKSKNDLNFKIYIQIISGFPEEPTFTFEKETSYNNIHFLISNGLEPVFIWKYYYKTIKFIKSLKDRGVNNNIKKLLPNIGDMKNENAKSFLEFDDLNDFFKIQDDQSLDFQKYYAENNIKGYKTHVKNKFKITKDDLSSWKWVNLIPEEFFDNPINLILTIGPSMMDNQFKMLHYGFAGDSEIAVGIKEFTLEHFQLNDFEKRKLNYKIKEDLRHIKETLNHELLHILQSASKNYTLGLPPKIKGKKHHNFEGIDAEGKRTQRHQFRPIEVYPRLGDSLFRFKEYIKDIPPDEQKFYIKQFIENDRNFKTVRDSITSKEEEQVYKNMIKTFLKEIQLLGYTINNKYKWRKW